MLASEEAKNDTVNGLRDEVRDWRQAGYPGTAVDAELWCAKMSGTAYGVWRYL